MAYKEISTAANADPWAGGQRPAGYEGEDKGKEHVARDQGAFFRDPFGRAWVAWLFLLGISYAPARAHHSAGGP